MKIKAPDSVRKLLTDHWERSKGSWMAKEEVWPVGNSECILPLSYVSSDNNDCLSQLPFRSLCVEQFM